MARDPDTADAALGRARELYRAGRFADGAALTGEAVAAFPQSPDLWNIHGVMLRQLGRSAEALAALDRALAVQPGHAGARSNRAGVALDIAQAHRAAGKIDAALAALDEGLARDPETLGLLEAKAVVLRSAGRRAEAEALLQAVVPRFPAEAWPQLYLGDLLLERDPAAAEVHLRRAHALAPGAAGPLVGLVQALARAAGAEEGAKLDEAHGLARQAAALGGLSPNEAKVLRDAFARVCDFAAIEALGDFRTLGRAWAAAGLHTAFFRHLPRVAGAADRVELLEQHRLCGAAMVAEAARQPIRRPAPRARDGKIRLGFLSSDLRRHPVGYFAEPLFRHVDAQRFELFCYGFDSGPPDALQSLFMDRASAFRRMPQATAREAAQTIADDGLDLLIDLGGSTAMNRLEVMAYGAAPRQASWLGYPHSAGLPTLDGLICDPFNRPTDPALLAEAAWEMPRTWIALGRASFSEDEQIAPQPPETRHGGLTFGTANNPYKYTPAALRTWASIVAAVPGSRFMILRPEAASAVFRANITGAFAAEGVGPERIVFRAVRGAHMAHYNEIDITLDTFPLTGGTTTVEALWMGALVISLRGEAFYERLSWSILANLGLEDLVADDLAGYRAAALRLAADPARRAELRTTVRERMKASPLGDPEGFARDFYALVERKVSAPPR